MKYFEKIGEMSTTENLAVGAAGVGGGVAGVYGGKHVADMAKAHRITNTISLALTGKSARETVGSNPKNIGRYFKELSEGVRGTESKKLLGTNYGAFKSYLPSNFKEYPKGGKAALIGAPIALAAGAAYATKKILE